MKKNSSALLGSVLPLLAAVPLILALQLLLPDSGELAQGPVYRGQEPLEQGQGQAQGQEQGSGAVDPAGEGGQIPLEEVLTEPLDPPDEAANRRSTVPLDQYGSSSSRA